MVTETLENKNLNLSSGPSSGERLTGLLQQTGITYFFALYVYISMFK